MERKTVINFSKVTFEVAPGNEQLGSFVLYKVSADLRFEWVPADRAAFANENIPPNKARLVIRLADVREIVRYNESMQTVALKLRLKGSSKLPLFRFHSYPQAFIAHMLEFLTFEKMISEVPTAPNRFQVLYTNKAGAKVREKQEYTDVHHYLFFQMHKSIIDSILADEVLKDEPLSLSDCLVFFDESGKCCHFTNLKREVFRRGLQPEARTLMWPLLLGVRVPEKSEKENEEHMKVKQQEYERLREQWEALTSEQRDNVQGIADVIRVVDNDVKRTDRTHPSFKDADSPNLVLLTHILTAYSIYNRDAGYVQGMGDLVSPFIILFIKEWKDADHAVMFDGTVKDKIEVESFMFWMLKGIMKTMQQDRMFTELSAHQQFAMERVYTIATFLHKPLKQWLLANEISELIFLYRPLLLLFKREFPSDVVGRLWDTFFAAVKPYSMPRFFLAALLMIMFPRLVQTNGSLGDVMSLSDKIISEIDGNMAVNLAIGLEERMISSGPQNEWVLEPLPSKSEYIDYVPHFLTLS